MSKITVKPEFSKRTWLLRSLTLDSKAIPFEEQLHIHLTLGTQSLDTSCSPENTLGFVRFQQKAAYCLSWKESFSDLRTKLLQLGVERVREYGSRQFEIAMSAWIVSKTPFVALARFIHFYQTTDNPPWLKVKVENVVINDGQAVIELVHSFRTFAPDVLGLNLPWDTGVNMTVDVLGQETIGAELLHTHGIRIEKGRHLKLLIDPSTEMKLHALAIQSENDTVRLSYQFEPTAEHQFELTTVCFCPGPSAPGVVPWSRMFFAIPEESWELAFVILSSRMRRTDFLDLPLGFKYLRIQTQSVSPILFPGNLASLSRTSADFLFDTLVCESSIKSLIDSAYQGPAPLVYNGIRDGVGNRAYHLLCWIESELWKKQSVSEQQRKYDVVAVVPEHPLVALTAAPLIRYLNALPLIDGPSLLETLEDRQASIRSRVVYLLGCLSAPQLSAKLQSRGYCVIEVGGQDETSTLVKIQEELLRQIVADFLLEQFKLVYRDEQRVDLLRTGAKDPVRSWAMQLLSDQALLEQFAEATKADYGGQLTPVHLSQLYPKLSFETACQLLAFEHYVVNMLPILVKGKLEPRIEERSPRNHLVLYAKDLMTPNLVQGVLYACSQKAYMLPLESPVGETKRELLRYLAGIKEEFKTSISQVGVARVLEGYAEKLTEAALSPIATEFIDRFSENFPLIRFFAGSIQMPVTFAGRSYSPSYDFFRLIIGNRAHLTLFSERDELILELAGKPPFDTTCSTGRLNVAKPEDTAMTIINSINYERKARRDLRFLIVAGGKDLKLVAPMVEFSEAMASAIGKLEVVRFDPSRGKKELISLIQTSDFITFWAHGAERKVALSSGQDRSLEITTDDIESLKLPRNPIVVLSSCSTAGPQIGTLHNLARAFTEAGAAAVIAPRWQIGEVDAARFLVNLLHSMIYDYSLSLILRKLKYLASKRDSLSFPNERAYVLYGDCRVAFVPFLKDEQMKIEQAYKQFTSRTYKIGDRTLSFVGEEESDDRSKPANQ